MRLLYDGRTAHARYNQNVDSELLFILSVVIAVIIFVQRIVKNKTANRTEVLTATGARVILTDENEIYRRRCNGRKYRNSAESSVCAVCRYTIVAYYTLLCKSRPRRGDKTHASRRNLFARALRLPRLILLPLPHIAVIAAATTTNAMTIFSSSRHRPRYCSSAHGADFTDTSFTVVT